MTGCRVGEKCEPSPLALGAVPIQLPVWDGSEAWHRAANLVTSGQYGICLGLRDDYNNTRRLLRPLAAITTLSLGFSVWSGFSTPEAVAAAPSADKSSKPTKADHSTGKTGAIVGGVLGASTGAWGAYEHWRLLQIPQAYALRNCDRVIATVKGGDVVPLLDDSREFQAVEWCVGAQVLMGDCTPPRRLPSVTEWSIEPLTAQQIALGVGVVIVGAAAVYTGVAEAAALAELAASWGWVPALAL